MILQRPQLHAEMGERDHDWSGCWPQTSLWDALTCWPPTRCTSCTPPAPRKAQRERVRDNGGHAVALAWSMQNIYDIGPGGDSWWAASDVGWVVGHSYIVYAPLLVGATDDRLRGQAGGARAGPAAFWRVIEQHGSRHCSPHPPRSRHPRKKTQTGLDRQPRSVEPANPVPGRRAPRPRYLPLGDTGARCAGRRQLVADRDGLAIAANPRGLEPLPIKEGSPSVPVPGYDVRVVDGQGDEVEAGIEGSIVIRLPLPPGTLPTLWNADERYVNGYLSAFEGFYTTGDGASSTPTATCTSWAAQTTSSTWPATDCQRLDRGGDRHPSRRGGVRSDRRTTR